MLIIINADDFGMREAANQAIVEAHRAGRLNSTTLLVDGAAVDSAVNLARQCPDLGVGLHLNLDSFLGYDVDGYYGRTLSNVNPEAYRQAIHNLADLEQAIEAQFERFFSFGLTMSHVDSHHNAHLLPAIFTSVIELAGRYNVRKMRFHRAFYEAEEALFEAHRRLLVERDFTTVTEFRDFGQPEAIFNLNSCSTELMAHLDKPGLGGEPWCEAQFERLMAETTLRPLTEQGAQLGSYHAL